MRDSDTKKYLNKYKYKTTHTSILVMLKNVKSLAIPIGIYAVYRYNMRDKRYTYEEVKKHNRPGDVWVIRKDDVYDVSKFVESHPGGKDKIMLAAGKSIDPYWNIYRQHENQNVQEILTAMKIGKVIDYVPTTKEDPYARDPVRSHDLKFHSYKPCNAETPVKLIADNPVTPSNQWYIRNHHPVPDMNEDEFFSLHRWEGARQYTNNGRLEEAQKDLIDNNHSVRREQKRWLQHRREDLWDAMGCRCH